MAGERHADPEKWWWFALGIGLLVLLYFLSPILTPFLLAGILAYIFNPLVGWLARHGTGRALAAVIALLILLGVLVAFAVIVVPLFYQEIKLLAERLPGTLARMNAELVPWLREHFGVELQLDAETVREYIADTLQTTAGLGPAALQWLKFGGLTLIGFAITVLLTPVVFFFVLRDWNKIVASIDSLIPRRWHGKAREIARQTDAVLAEFLRGQIAVIVVMSSFYCAGLWLTRLEFFLPIGMITGVLVFVPYVGWFVGLVLATLAALMQFGASTGLLWVWLVYGIGTALEGALVTPWLVGQRIGLHPVAVIFAILAFGQIFGFFGVLLALPASAALLVALRHLHRRYYASQLFGREPE